MKYIILSVLTAFCNIAFGQTLAKLGPTEQKLNDALCECLNKQDLSKIATKEQAAVAFNGCIMQKPQLVVDLAAERKISLNDTPGITKMGEEVGKNLVINGCQSAIRLFQKMNGISAEADDKVSNHTGQDSIYVINIKKDAEKIVTAIFKGDYDVAIKYTYPEILKAAGGNNMIIETINKTLADFKSKGITFKNVKIGQPGEFIKTPNKIFSIVPEEIFLDVKGKTLYSKSALLAVSLDKGSRWYFIDAAGLTNDTVNQLFPEANHKLILPTKTQPILLD